jgi:hypothetical protein
VEILEFPRSPLFSSKCAGTGKARTRGFSGLIARRWS